MRTLNLTPIQEENTNVSPESNPNRKGNESPVSTPKVKYPFPYNGGLFSEAARRKKAAQIVNVIENIIGNEKKLGLAYLPSR